MDILEPPLHIYFKDIELTRLDIDQFNQTIRNKKGNDNVVGPEEDIPYDSSTEPTRQLEQGQQYFIWYSDGNQDPDSPAVYILINVRLNFAGNKELRGLNGDTF